MNTILITTLAALAPVATQEAGSDFRQLQEEYQVAMDAFHAEELAVREADGAEAAAAFAAEKSPVPAFLDRALGLAVEHAGSEDAVSFLNWVLTTEADEAPESAGTELGEASRASLEMLLSAYPDDQGFQRTLERFGRMGDYMGSLNRARYAAVLDLTIEQTTTDHLRILALFSRGMLRAGWERTAAEKAQAKADFERVRELGGEHPLGEEADAYLFELARLQKGMVAPEIEGEDLDGVAFKLSDYRGKVVMLDFWGDW